MSASAGTLSIALARNGNGKYQATLSSSRPQAARLLVGKPPQLATQLAPLLFSLCGGAQGVAAEAALMAAQGQLPNPEQLAQWEHNVRREAASEHGWHLLLDWPQACGLGQRHEEYASFRQACLTAKSPRELSAMIESLLHHVLGLPARQWLAQTSWHASLAALGTKLLKKLADVNDTSTKPATLPTTSAQDWAAHEQEIAQGHFSTAPHWQGINRETGALARQGQHDMVDSLIAQGRNIEARLCARLVELARWALGDWGAPWVDSATCGNGIGIASVQTARGLLLHRAGVSQEMKQQRVEAYTIVAPTEWNFHPQGAFVGEMPDLCADDAETTLQHARWLALSLDPCVEYEIKYA